MSRHSEPRMEPDAGQADQPMAPRRSFGKELIVRMLAEVFQVSQPGEGLRWQQVSDSLVPVSLYSRTTGPWLEYLLAAAPGSGQTAPSTMSPDSRQFLQLLQQFHHQARGQTAAQTGKRPLVFQVLAHQFVGPGHSRKILNARLCQPGTRLGRPTEFFVYWRTDQAACRPERGPSSSGPGSPYRSQTGQHHQHHQQHTWGLNFASVNDAKLFYDICSLNSVQLNFNLAYLSHLANLTATGYQQLQRPLAYPQHEKLIVNNQTAYNQPYQNNSTKPLFASNSSSSAKFPCIDTIAGQPFMTNNYSNNNNNYDATPNQGAFSQMQPISERNNSCFACRTRSRSINRQPINRDLEDQIIHSGRARSFSSPPTSEHKQHRPACPVSIHQRPDSSNELEFVQNASNRFTNHHPRCLTLIKQQQELLKLQLSGLNQIPKKPARGELRKPNDLVPSLVSPCDFQNQDQIQLCCDERFGMINIKPENIDSVETNNINDKSGNSMMSNFNFGPVSEVKQDDDENHHAMLASRFVNSKSAQRRSTGVDLCNENSNLVSRNAQLARAQYANSKNMKEFLSLDVGCTQIASTDKSANGEKSYQQLRPFYDRNDLISGTSENKDKPPKCITVDQNNDDHQGDPSHNVSINNSRKFVGPAHKSSSDSEWVLDPKESNYQADVMNILAPISNDRLGQNVKNVSTTTDDLPLDSLTRNRMLKLATAEVQTDQEKISYSGRNHHTFSSELCSEKCMSRSDNQNICKPVMVHSCQIPSSRRCSLERRANIEYDHSSVFKSKRSLKSFEQSLQPRLCPSKSSPALIQQVSDSTPKHMKELDCNKLLSRKRLRTKSSGESDSCKASKLRPNMQFKEIRLNSDTRNFHNYDQHRRDDHTTIDFNSRSNFIHGHESHLKSYPEKPITMLIDETNFDYRQQSNGNAKSTASKIESKRSYSGSKVVSIPFTGAYAVPLCSNSNLSSGNPSQKALSCPNSLRRQTKLTHISKERVCCRTNYAHVYKELINEHNCQNCHKKLESGISRNLDHTSPAFYDYGKTTNDDTYSNNLEYCACQFIRNSNHNYPLQATHDDKSTISPQKQQHFGGSIQNVPNNYYDTKAGRFQTESCVQISNSQQIPYGNQSPKSPLRCALNDDDAENVSPIFSEVCRNGVISSYPQKNRFHRPLSTDYRPILEPVQGYDQTMARNTSKSRQRSRSQPPDNENGIPFNLTKSMENVRKLIKEVQKELENFESRPIIEGDLTDVKHTTSFPNQSSGGKETNPEPTKVSASSINNGNIFMEKCSDKI